MEPTILRIAKNLDTPEISGPIVVEEPSIKTTSSLIRALREGEIPGNSIIRWEDDKGTLEANVVDFLLEDTIRTKDVHTEEEVKVNSMLVPDGAWRLYVRIR